MSKNASDAASEKNPKSPRVWPKLLLWSLVLAFGFLYLRSLDYSSKDYPRAEAPTPAAQPQQAAPPKPATPPQLAAPPRPAAPLPAAMPQGAPHGQTAAAPRQPARPAPVQPSVQAQNQPAAPSATTNQAATAGQGAIKAAESEAFAQRVMRDQSQAQRPAPSPSPSVAESQAPTKATNQPRTMGGTTAVMPPRYPQPPTYGYGQPPAQAPAAQPSTAYQDQYTEYMRQQREAYEAARERWEKAYGQYPQGQYPQGQYPQAPAYGGYPGYYPPGYYQGGR